MVSLHVPVMWLCIDLALMWLGLCLVLRVIMTNELQKNKRAVCNSEKEVSEQSAVSIRGSILVYRPFFPPNACICCRCVIISQYILNYSTLQKCLIQNVSNLKTSLFYLHPRPWCAVRAKWRRWKKRTQSCSFDSRSWTRNTVQGLRAICRTYLWDAALTQATNEGREIWNTTPPPAVKPAVFDLGVHWWSGRRQKPFRDLKVEGICGRHAAGCSFILQSQGGTARLCSSLLQEEASEGHHDPSCSPYCIQVRPLCASKGLPIIFPVHGAPWYKATSTPHNRLYTYELLPN